ncbi:hypothetical protein [Ructibacterium gallinarum]|uniref:Uncharacterized protein n=1 Tax=Ructibacterium gallinarum TaxID=2779355 RepID=A0A9D5R7P1_9FIRM|nr:hypothetical protein [Ructibacterium gallinarum]MBE5039431.1 hypothetical protein [Ructibacterium gallinarum]
MDIMQAIVDIENTVRGITDSTAELEKDYDKKIQEEIRQKEQETDIKVKEKLEQLKMQMNAERQEEMEHLETVYEKKLEALSNTCKEQQETWIHDMTQAVIQP